MSLRQRWIRFKQVAKNVAQRIREETPHWPFGYRLHIRLMGQAQSKKEGFAMYDNRTLRVNRRTLSLPERDWTLLAIHEIGGHHLQAILQDHRLRGGCNSVRCQAAEEHCAMSCERRWGRQFGIESTVHEWKRYRQARVALDRAVQRGTVRTESQAYTLFQRHGVPRRLTRIRPELLRVREWPGEVRGYLHGRIRDSPDCPCVY
jgi:hypothetical protein